MAKTHPSWTVDTTFSSKNIASAASVYAFTAAADARVSFTVKLTNAAGGGDYVVYLTHDWLGGSAAATLLPKTTATAAAGETKIQFVTIPIDVKATDVVNVMVDGLAGDKSVSGAIRIVADNPSVFEATDTVSTVTTLTNMPAAAPSASDNATAAAAAILVTPANKLATGAAGVASANVTQVKGAVPADLDEDGNFPTAASSGGLTAQQVRDAMKLAPTAGTPADGSVDDHLDDLAAALAAATSTLTVVSAVDGDVITIYQAVSFQATISGLAIPAGWTKVYWTVKRATSEADTDAILQMVETNPSAGTDGLLRVNGAAGTAGNGSLTVNQAAGTVVIDLIMTVCDDLALATGLVWSLKALHPTSAATLLATGTVNVLGQATAAVA